MKKFFKVYGMKSEKEFINIFNAFINSFSDFIPYTLKNFVTHKKQHHGKTSLADHFRTEERISVEQGQYSLVSEHPIVFTKTTRKRCINILFVQLGCNFKCLLSCFI